MLVKGENAQDDGVTANAIAVTASRRHSPDEGAIWSVKRCHHPFLSVTMNSKYVLLLISNTVHRISQNP